MTLRQFLAEVDRLIDEALSDAAFHETQRELLAKTAERYRPLARANPFADPLWRSALYFVVRANGRQVDARVEYVASFCTLYLLAADLMDDVQDDDLAGKPHESAGAAVAANNAVALLFLALSFLERAAALESPAQARRYYELFNHTSVLAVAGQHRDLLGIEGARLPNEVLEMLRSRNSSLSMILQYGALLCGCDDSTCARYAELAEKIILCGQIREDLSDIFGKDLSPDLGTNKVTYPVACFLEDACAEDCDTFRHLLAGLPGTLREIRALLYRSGVVERCAQTMEALREDIHGLVAELDNPSAYLRCMLQMVDGFAESVYEPPPIERTRPLFEPAGDWHCLVRRHLDLFLDRMRAYDPPGAPALIPWHLPQWLYVPDKRAIYYPDLDGLAEEILPMHAELLQVDDAAALLSFQYDQVPGTLSHEMFHYWRDTLGRLTNDHWHEEWVANELAVTYVNRFEPEVLGHTLKMAHWVVQSSPESLAEPVRAVLSSCQHSCPEQSQDYDMSLRQITVTHFEMLLQITSESIDLPSAVSRLLGKKSPSTGIAA